MHSQRGFDARASPLMRISPAAFRLRRATCTSCRGVCTGTPEHITRVTQLVCTAVEFCLQQHASCCWWGVQVVDRALQAQQTLHVRQELPNPNRRRLWLLPLLITVQVAVKVLLLDRVIEADSWRGDKNGDYDPETQRCGTSTLCV